MNTTQICALCVEKKPTEEYSTLPRLQAILNEVNEVVELVNHVTQKNTW